jgi:pimeloyl-ACP methyl ester carboxylesterase
MPQPMSPRPFEPVLSDGLEIAVEEFGNGPPIVFAHGLTGNRHASRDQLAPLAERYRIVIYDQRGHCDSTPVIQSALYDVDRMAGDMTAVMDALGIARAIVGGDSMGAATTMAFALKHPERVTSLLLSAPAFGDRPNPQTQRLKNMGRAITNLGMEEFLKRAAIRQRDELGWSPEVIAYVGRSYASHDPASLATALRTVPDWLAFADLSVVASLTQPACILAWENDPLHPIELARRIAALMPAARLETIASQSAFFANPRLAGTIYESFLASLWSSAGGSRSAS